MSRNPDWNDVARGVIFGLITGFVIGLMANCRTEKSPQERYEDYIENISWNYVGACGDDWGGFESRAIARKLHSFEDWQMAGEP